MICENMLKERKIPEIPFQSGDNWEETREKLKDIIQDQVFGYRPEDPTDLSFEEISRNESFCAGKATLCEMVAKGKLYGKEFSFPFFTAIPKKEGKHPFFTYVRFRNDVPDRFAPTEEIMDHGFAILSVCYNDVTKDDNDFNDGLAGLIYGGRERQGSECGKIALWSWALSRLMDYAQTLDCLDFERSAVIGHSRLGKTALFTGMMDERFKVVISNDSGCSGAAISRGKQGEPIQSICDTFPYWFCPNYWQYKGKEYEMPFDQHFMLSAIAPRRLYIASALEDTWADPVSEYLGAVAAGEVYEKLGLTGFIHADRLPEPTDVFQEGNVAYHLRYGCHYLGREDWMNYVKYIEKM